MARISVAVLRILTLRAHSFSLVVLLMVVFSCVVFAHRRSRPSWLPLYNVDLLLPGKSARPAPPNSRRRSLHIATVCEVVTIWFWT